MGSTKLVYCSCLRLLIIPNPQTINPSPEEKFVHGTRHSLDVEWQQNGCGCRDQGTRNPHNAQDSPAKPGRVQALAEGLGTAELVKSLGPGQRSITENLAHILNGEARSTEAILQALLLKEPLLPRIHPERQLGQLWRLDRYRFADLLAYFRFRRRVLLGVLRSPMEKQWARTIQEPGQKRRESVYWQARGQALYEVDHLADMAERLAGRPVSR